MAIRRFRTDVTFTVSPTRAEGAAPARQFDGNDVLDKRYKDDIEIIPSILSITLNGGGFASIGRLASSGAVQPARDRSPATRDACKGFGLVQLLECDGPCGPVPIRRAVSRLRRRSNSGESLRDFLARCVVRRHLVGLVDHLPDPLLERGRGVRLRWPGGSRTEIFPSSRWRSSSARRRCAMRSWFPSWVSCVRCCHPCKALCCRRNRLSGTVSCEPAQVPAYRRDLRVRPSRCASHDHCCAE